MYEWQLELIRALQVISNGFTDAIFKGITMMGDEIFFIGLAAVLFICFDKKFGFKLIMVFLLSSFIVDLMKDGFMVDRPYILDPSVGIGSPTEGYSFPSGHTMTATMLFGMTALWLIKTYKLTGKKKAWTYATAGILIFLVAFSRMYLGQHFLTDVAAGFLVGAVTILLYLVLDRLFKGREVYWTAIIVPAIVLMIVFPQQKNYYMAAGVIASVASGYFIEKKFVRYDVKEKWYVQIIKAVVCLGIAFLIKDGLKPL